MFPSGCLTRIYRAASRSQEKCGAGVPCQDASMCVCTKSRQSEKPAARKSTSGMMIELRRFSVGFRCAVCPDGWSDVHDVPQQIRINNAGRICFISSFLSANAYSEGLPSSSAIPCFAFLGKVINMPCAYRVFSSSLSMRVFICAI